MKPSSAIRDLNVFDQTSERVHRFSHNMAKNTKRQK